MAVEVYKNYSVLLDSPFEFFKFEFGVFLFAQKKSKFAGLYYVCMYAYS